MGKKGKTGGFIYQILQEFDKLNCIGQSKHEAKKEERKRCQKAREPYNPARVPGIYSYTTLKTYKQEALTFAEWVREEHNVRKFGDITREHVKEYLQQGIDRNLSPYTLKTQRAAMAKLLKCRGEDFGIKLPVRQSENITRSRIDREHDLKFSTKRHKDLIDFCRASGLRRHEIKKLKPKDIYEKDGHIYIHTKGKGGKEREALVTKKGQQHILQMKENAERENRSLVFDKIVNRMDVHAERAVYAKDLYKELEEEGKGIGKTRKRRSDKKVFYINLLREVSKNLGHSRINVIVQHYLY